MDMRCVYILTIFGFIGIFYVIEKQLERPHARATIERPYCVSNMKNLGLAVLNYSQQDTNNILPLPSGNQFADQPAVSWRVQLLHIIDRGEIYRRYAFDEPWNGPSNRPLRSWRVEIYQCPASKSFRQSPHTNFFAVTGTQTPFDPNQ